eukprot:GDKJ01049726.1.p1 GENE.GDKJ01049726.1~~GDKJ01049726.1.p1  ORF type:complete len:314 (+),score=86.87 GDKJ01049726.1:1-942(+)
MGSSSNAEYMGKFIKMSQPLVIDVEKFQRDGFLVIPGAFSQVDLKSIKDQMQKLIEASSIKKHTFDTIDQKQKDDVYFLESGKNISFFYEDGVFDSNGELKVEKSNAINKVGHALHDLDETFMKFSYHPTLLKVCKTLGHKQPQILQSMYIFKSPHVGGEVTPHQDTTFIQTNPHTCIGTWVGLEDATKENGCLWVVPGSHLLGVHRYFNLNEEGTACSFVGEAKYDITNAVPVEVTAGSLVILHGALVHFSGHNYSSASRNAYTLHVIDSAPEVEYLKTNWIRRGEDFPLKDFEKTSKQIYGEDLVNQILSA